MAHPNESNPQHAIPNVGWHDPGAQKRPGTLRPLPLPIHPHVPAIPGGVPGVIPGRTAISGPGHFVSTVHTPDLTGRSSAGGSAMAASQHLIATNPIESLGTRTGIIPGRSGLAPLPAHPAAPHVNPPHVSRPVLR